MCSFNEIFEVCQFVRNGVWDHTRFNVTLTATTWSLPAQLLTDILQLHKSRFFQQTLMYKQVPVRHEEGTEGTIR